MPLSNISSLAPSNYYGTILLPGFGDSVLTQIRVPMKLNSFENSGIYFYVCFKFISWLFLKAAEQFGKYEQ